MIMQIQTKLLKHLKQDSSNNILLIDQQWNYGSILFHATQLIYETVKCLQ